VVSVESECGKGSVFKVTFPVKHAAAVSSKSRDGTSPPDEAHASGESIKEGVNEGDSKRRIYEKQEDLNCR
jgi:hypothetical protein